MLLLLHEQYLAILGKPPQWIGPEELHLFDFWPCLRAIPESDFEGHDCSDGKVRWAWCMPLGPLCSRLVSTEDRNVFMVVVLDWGAREAHGHRLLDLNCENGLGV